MAAMSRRKNNPFRDNPEAKPAAANVVVVVTSPAVLSEPVPAPRTVARSIRIALGAGGTGVAITFAVGSLGPAGLINMTTAYIMLTVAWIASTVVVALSEFVLSFKIHHRVFWIILSSVASGVILGAVGYYEYNANYQLTHITPGNEAAPAASCEIPKGSLTVYLGDSVSASTTGYPYNIIYEADDIEDISSARTPLLQINAGNGGIDITILRLFDENGKIISVIDHNQPWINSNFRNKKDESGHNLIIYDDKDNEALNLRFLNKESLYITGTLFTSMSHRINITGTHIDFSKKDDHKHKLIFENICLIGGAAFAISPEKMGIARYLPN